MQGCAIIMMHFCGLQTQMLQTIVLMLQTLMLGCHSDVKDFQSKLLKLMMIFGKATKSIELYNIINKYEEDLKQLNDEELRIIDVAVSILEKIYAPHKPIELSTALKKLKSKETSGMFTELIANEKNV